MRRPHAAASSCLLLLLASVPVEGAEPHRSYQRLVSANGFSVAAYDVAARRIDTFLEHPYRFRTPRPGDDDDLCFSADETRDLAYDTYLGVRSGSGAGERGQWLPDLALVEHGYEPGTGLMRAVQRAGDGDRLVVESWAFVPMTLEGHSLVQIARVRNESDSPMPASVYALFNFHLGSAAGGREPSSLAEQVSSAGDAVPAPTLYEYSDESEGTMAYVALTPLAHHEVSSSANGVFAKLPALTDLNDVSATAGPSDDVVPGFQSAQVLLEPGAELWFASAAVWAGDSDAQPDVEALIAWWASRTPAQVLDDERAAWSAWHTTSPSGLSAEQEALWRQSAAFLRMGQVREPGSGFGQILASLPPGLGDVNAQWNIAWVRDMAYAVVGLARAGHLDEAERALTFQLQAGPGRHTAFVGDDYRISVTRYFGDGQEESDCNEDGPNVEYDGFGLFLWSLGEYVRAGGDVSALAPSWSIIEEEIGDVLVSLLDDDGVIRADSSIWEVHWNGRERRFTYTSLAAAVGLCELASVASALGHDDDAARFAAAGARVRDAVVALHTDESGVLAQSREDLVAGTSYIDAATVEAINWGVVAPGSAVASATLSTLLAELSVAGTPGLMRNDDGGWYDSQEWVFVDLRLVPALVAAGNTGKADELLAWLEGQALANDLQLAELHAEGSADYAGSIPMLGFGAGAYLIARSDAPVLGPACGDYATWPETALDAGLLDDAGIDPLDDGGGLGDSGQAQEDAATRDDAGPTTGDDGGTRDDGGSRDSGEERAPTLPPRDGGGPPTTEDCSCAQASTTPSTSFSGGLAVVAVALLFGRRRRRDVSPSRASRSR